MNATLPVGVTGGDPAGQRGRASARDGARLLRHRADVWPLALVSAVLAARIGVFLVEPLWLACVLSVVVLPFQAVTIACNHYHHHQHVFRSRVLNRVYELVLFMETGLSPYMLTLHHNIAHHRDYLRPETDTLLWKRPDGRVLGFPEYMARNFVRLYSATFRVARSRPVLGRKFKGMLALGSAPLILLLYLQPARTVVALVGPMVLMMLHVVRMGYVQHVGLATDDAYHASTNAEGRLYNVLTFNSGLHTAHHLCPSLHWSRLPELHRRIRRRIPASLLMGALRV